MVKKKTKKTDSITPVRVVEQPVSLESSPRPLLEMAISKGVAIDQLERLIKLQERWEDRQAKKLFNEAFSQFQKICPPLVKNRTADFGAGKANYQYQELADIQNHIREPLAQCGLSTKWSQKDNGTEVEVWLIVSHVGGHDEIGTPIKGNLDTSGNKQGIQAKASTISYLRRYTLTGGLGIASADRDDDGTRGAKAAAAASDGVMDAKQFKATMKKVAAGEVMVDKVKEFYTLTEDQENALRVAEKNADKPEPQPEVKL